MNIVRKLKTTELPILTQLFNYKDIDDMIFENTRNIQNGIVDIFALFDDNKLIGELHVKYDNEDKDFAEKGNRAYLFAFRIHKDYQGKGLGSYLLKTVIDELNANGYHELTVGVEDDNIRARYKSSAVVYDAVVSATSTPIDEQVIEIVYIVDWKE